MQAIQVARNNALELKADQLNDHNYLQFHNDLCKINTVAVYCGMYCGILLNTKVYHGT